MHKSDAHPKRCVVVVALHQTAQGAAIRPVAARVHGRRRTRRHGGQSDSKRRFLSTEIESARPRGAALPTGPRNGVTFASRDPVTDSEPVQTKDTTGPLAISGRYK